ncbi:MAG: DUF2793 domain-containing protein [Rhizomicrobium sp.]
MRSGCARILDRDLTAPPPSPTDGDTYLVHATATGDWTGQDGRIAYALDDGWRFYAPFAGLMAYVVDEAKPIVFDGAAWNDFVSLLSLDNLPMLGINTTADATNKLAVKSAALLFDNIGNGVQVKLNKNASGDTRFDPLPDELFRPRGVRPDWRRQFPLQGLARRIELDRCAVDRQSLRRDHTRCGAQNCRMVHRPRPRSPSTPIRDFITTARTTASLSTLRAARSAMSGARASANPSPAVAPIR